MMTRADWIRKKAELRDKRIRREILFRRFDGILDDPIPPYLRDIIETIMSLDTVKLVFCPHRPINHLTFTFGVATEKDTERFKDYLDLEQVPGWVRQMEPEQ